MNRKIVKFTASKSKEAFIALEKFPLRFNDTKSIPLRYIR